MKIAMFITQFPYQSQFKNTDLSEEYIISGGELAGYHFAVNLGLLGHEVIVFTSSYDSQKSIEEYDGLKIYRYPAKFKIGDTIVSPSLLWGPNKDVKDVDIVHIQHTTPPGGAAGLYCGKKWKKPIVLTHHGFERYDSYGNIIRKLIVFLTANLFVDFLFSKVSAIISISPHFVKRSRFLGKYEEKTVVIPNGVNLNEYNTSAPVSECKRKLGLPIDKNIILFLGSLIPRKGVDVLIEAMRQVMDDFPDSYLVVVGRGPKEKELKDLAHRLDISKSVHFQGFVAKSELKNMYYRAADVFVVPSLSDMEMFPLVLLEGSAAGCAMVVSDLETFKAIVNDNENAIIVKSGDVFSLAEGIKKVIEDQDLKNRLSKEAENTAQRFSWDLVAKETEDLYEKVLSGSNLA